MDEKRWWQSKTILGSIVTALSGIIALTGHNIDAGTQVQLVNLVSSVADAVTIIGGLYTAWARTKVTTTIKPV